MALSKDQRRALKLLLVSMSTLFDLPVCAFFDFVLV